MSEKRMKRRRYNQRLEYIARFDLWLNNEPPMWRFWKWRKWKARRPIWRDVERTVDA